MAGNEIKIVIAGHVDHGKSTLVGRFLCDTGQMPADRKEKIEKRCKKDGKRFEFAFLLDAFEEEQDQGITIDATEIRWSFGGKRFLLIDTPGHREFSKNMVTGASKADAAIILLDAGEGIREQFRRHSHILAMLGIENIIVAVNKMDLAAYNARRFAAIKKEAGGFLARIGIPPAAVIPICALHGENLVQKSPRMPWYAGKPLAGALLDLKATRNTGLEPFRFSIQDVYKSGGKRIYAGRVESGILRKGREVEFLPSGKGTCVKTIEKWREPGIKTAKHGDCVGITLAEPLPVERGEVAVGRKQRAIVSDLVRANIFWMGDQPLTAGRGYKFRLAAQEAGCRLVSVENVIDADTFEKMDASEDAIARNNMGDVTLQLDRPLVYDEFSKVAAMGRFVLVDGERVSGGGIILGDTRAGFPGREIKDRKVFTEKSGITKEARKKRNGHPGFAIWLTGLPGSGKSTIARELEKRLFETGVQVYALDGDNIRHGINRDLGFSSADRAENIRRLSEIAGLFSDAGLAVITAFISPFESDRKKARETIGAANFIEVFVDCPLEVCEKRDPKGLYKKARRGEILNFTGVHAPYEKPVRPDITLRTDKIDAIAAVKKIIDFLERKGKTGTSGRRDPAYEKK
ncbi:MAG: adenylyl-sulfate kinase [Elusimicrobia bacterium]|nr:adenylyl-sulfate kinase [Elusimicrobiota bacterium]